MSITTTFVNMGLTFLGNPYENEYDYDSDGEINSVEELVIPPNLTNVSFYFN